jgi:hypothetical protein
VAQAISDGADAEETIDELLAALRRFSKRR